ncbi:RICIN domain-containing protein [Saccharothrix sp. HUAS TT1]|uniref:RICIN domain-containing protein n=1 Tax=unclassified Saccharothrix TaxID=2593673 RepID=UPI00345B8754
MAGDDAQPVITDPPDPRTASDIVVFVALLRRLRQQAGNPGYKKTLERATRDEYGVPRISGSTMHRVLEGRQDLTRMRDPDLFVREVVTALGADPAPWLEVLDRLLRSAPECPAEPSARTGGGDPAIRTGRVRGRVLVAVVAVLLVATGVVAWSATGPDEPPAVPVTAPARLSITLAADPGLRLAVDRAAESAVAHVLLAGGGTADAGWEVVAPHRGSPGFWQLRPTGRLLVCLEVFEGRRDAGTMVQQYGCNGERHQYWKPEPQPDGAVRWVSLHSQQCLTVAHARPHVGAELAQQECDPARAALQHWRTAVADVPAAASPSTAPGGVVGPDPAEYPGGGEDRPCPGLAPAHVPDVSGWTELPSQTRHGSFATTEDAVSLGPATFGEAELRSASRTTDTGAEEVYFWAEGLVRFSPGLFSMSLQWTTSRDDGDWHTCTESFTAEYDSLTTAALPRDVDHDGAPDVAFRVCLGYAPELAPRTPVVNCSGRH